MSALLPVAVFGLEVPAGDIETFAKPEFPAAFRLTMAALDPTAEPEFSGSATNSTVPRATLKLFRLPFDPDEEDDEDEEDSAMEALLNGGMDDSEEDSSDDEDVNGGPSDPAKSKKARKEAAAMKALKDAMEEAQENEELANGVNGASKNNKGKAVALNDDDMENSDEDDLDEDDLEEFVICTLDPNQHYQQPIDVTIGEKEKVFFKVSGTHSIYLTGNYVIPVDDSPRMPHDEEDEDDEYDYNLGPEEDELDDESESDELDDMEDPRIMELRDEEEAPKLIEAAKGKGKNKRPATGSDGAEELATLDKVMEKSLKAEPNGDVKLNQKQTKKLKNNAGKPIATVTESDTKTVKKEESPSGKKVQFAKNLEQGPTGKSEPPKSQDNAKKNAKKEEKKDAPKKESEPSKGVRVVQGVKIDDRKIGTGPVAKKGSSVSMRYIGKLADAKVFDSNKKGKPFKFKLGAGEVIKGWEIGIEGLAAGGERRIIVPPNLGYGNKAITGIPANSELTFDVKCMAVE